MEPVTDRSPPPETNEINLHSLGNKEVATVSVAQAPVAMNQIPSDIHVVNGQMQPANEMHVRLSQANPHDRAAPSGPSNIFYEEQSGLHMRKDIMAGGVMNEQIERDNRQGHEAIGQVRRNPATNVGHMSHVVQSNQESPGQQMYEAPGLVLRNQALEPGQIGHQAFPGQTAHEPFGLDVRPAQTGQMNPQIEEPLGIVMRADPINRQPVYGPAGPTNRPAGPANGPGGPANGHIAHVENQPQRHGEIPDRPKRVLQQRSSTDEEKHIELPDILKSGPFLAQNQGNRSEEVEFRLIEIAQQSGVRASIDGTTSAMSESNAKREVKAVGEGAYRVQIEIIADHRNASGGLVSARIGQGTFGSVYKATRKTSRNQQSICLKQAKGCDLNFKALQNEWDVLNNIAGHDNIIRGDALYLYDSHAFLCLEYFTGAALTLLIHCATNKFMQNGQNRTRPIIRKEILSIMKQMLSGLHHLHQRGIIHFDIKPDNILYSIQSKALKIIDFGLACGDLHPNEKIIMRNRGTINYMAPEVMHAEYGVRESDIFSAGATALHLATCVCPYLHLPGVKEAAADDRKNRVREWVKTFGTQTLQEHAMEACKREDRDVGELISRLLHSDPFARPPTESIMDRIDELLMSVVDPNFHGQSSEQYTVPEGVYDYTSSSGSSRKAMSIQEPDPASDLIPAFSEMFGGNSEALGGSTASMASQSEHGQVIRGPSQPASAAGYQPASSAGYQPASAAGYQPASAAGFQPAPAAGFHPSLMQTGGRFAQAEDDSPATPDDGHFVSTEDSAYHMSTQEQSEEL